MMALLKRVAALALLCVPLATAAQTAEKVYQIGWLSGTAVSASKGIDAFRQRLRELGWVEGRNIALVFRHGDGQVGKLNQQAAELVKMKVDVIVAAVPSALAAARRATTTIPIVMVYGPDPVEAGIVSSLARPGGNITGLTSLSADLGVKQFELLRAIVPGASRVAVLWNPTNPWHADALTRIESAARGLGVGVRGVPVRTPDDLNGAFATMAKGQADALLSLSDPMTFSQRAKLAGLALKHRLPMMSGVTEYAEAGGLASYWPSIAEIFQGAALYVHRILSGARPGELPIEQPKTFELLINLRTAKALDITIPAPVLARADRVIE